MKKLDKILIVAVLLIAVIAGGFFYATKDKGAYVIVSVNLTDYGKYYLNKDQIVQINDTNTLEIKDGKAKMIDAKCPDHICMYMPAINETHDSIVCLPNQVIVEVLEE